MSSRGKGYRHPVKRALRRVLRVKPCGCGCDIIYVRGRAEQFRDAGPVARWLTFNPDGD